MFEYKDEDEKEDQIEEEDEKEDQLEKEEKKEKEDQLKEEENKEDQLEEEEEEEEKEDQLKEEENKEDQLEEGEKTEDQLEEDLNDTTESSLLDFDINDGSHDEINQSDDGIVDYVDSNEVLTPVNSEKSCQTETSPPQNKESSQLCSLESSNKNENSFNIQKKLEYKKKCKKNNNEQLENQDNLTNLRDMFMLTFIIIGIANSNYLTKLMTSGNQEVTNVLFNRFKIKFFYSQLKLKGSIRNGECKYW
jgi:hypothetical protein